MTKPRDLTCAIWRIIAAVTVGAILALGVALPAAKPADASVSYRTAGGCQVKIEVYVQNGRPYVRVSALNGNCWAVEGVNFYYTPTVPNAACYTHSMGAVQFLHPSNNSIITYPGPIKSGCAFLKAYILVGGRNPTAVGGWYQYV